MVIVVKMSAETPLRDTNAPHNQPTTKHAITHCNHSQPMPIHAWLMGARHVVDDRRESCGGYASIEATVASKESLYSLCICIKKTVG